MRRTLRAMTALVLLAGTLTLAGGTVAAAPGGGSTKDNGCGAPSAAEGAGTGGLASGKCDGPQLDGCNAQGNVDGENCGKGDGEDDAEPTVVDNPPTITGSSFSGTAGSGGWYRSGGTVSVTCDDDNPGVTGSADPASITADGVYTVTLTCTDSAAQTDTDEITIRVDSTPPAAAITTPANGARMILGSTAVADFACTDGGSGVASCTGTLADGDAIDTSSVGARTFGVDAGDVAGNTSSASSAYNVVYAVCGGGSAHTVGSPFKAGAISAKRGRDVPVKIRVCDAAGVSVGTPGVVTSLAGPSVVSQNTHQSFRFSDGQWIFNLSTDLLSVGSHGYVITLADGSTIPFTVNVTR